MKMLNNKSGQTRSMILIGLVVYFVILTIFLSFMGATYGSSLPNYTTTQKEIASGVVINVVTGIQLMPWWLNLLFLTVPLLVITYLVVVALIPTTNAGA